MHAATFIISALSKAVAAVRLLEPFIDSPPAKSALRDLDTTVNDVINLLKPSHDEAVRVAQRDAVNRPQPQPPTAEQPGVGGQSPICQPGTPSHDPTSPAVPPRGPDGDRLVLADATGAP